VNVRLSQTATGSPSDWQDRGAAEEPVRTGACRRGWRRHTRSPCAGCLQHVHAAA
jgi:hypothetical protein